MLSNTNNMHFSAYRLWGRNNHRGINKNYLVNTLHLIHTSRGVSGIRTRGLKHWTRVCNSCVIGPNTEMQGKQVSTSIHKSNYIQKPMSVMR